MVLTGRFEAGHSSTCGPVPATHVHSEHSALADHVSTELAPPATGWRETGEEAGPAATEEAGDGENCTYSDDGSNTGFHFYKVAASFPG